MKRRLLSGIATLLCVVLFAFGLAACGEVAVESVTLDKTELALEIGGKETLTATVAPENATNKSVTWSSDNPAVATVDNGKVSAVAEGTATVTATVGDKSATCSVTVNAPAPTTEVTAEKWAQIMESTDNFTYDTIMQRPQTAPMTMTVKVDGAKRMQMMDGAMQILVKEGTEYNGYAFSDGVWTKSTLDEARYEASGSSAALLSYFKDDFASFTYADGKYTAASLDKTTTMNGTLNNVEVTFANGALVGIKFSISSDGDIYTCEVKDVGTTTITLPSEYTTV